MPLPTSAGGGGFCGPPPPSLRHRDPASSLGLTDRPPACFQSFSSMPGSITTGVTLRYRCDRGVNDVSTDDVNQVSFLDFIESAGGLWPTRWSEAPGVGLEPTTYGSTV